MRGETGCFKQLDNVFRNIYAMNSILKYQLCLSLKISDISYAYHLKYQLCLTLSRYYTFEDNKLLICPMW